MASTFMEGISAASQAKDAYAARQEEPKKSILPVVLGGSMVKILFLALGVVSLGLFAATAVSICITAATEKITSVAIQFKDEIPFPVVWMCVQHSTQDSADWVFLPQGNENQCVSTNTDTFTLLLSRMDASLQSEEECITMSTGTKFTTWLETSLGGGVDCYSINEDGEIKDSRKKPLTISFLGSVTLQGDGHQEAFLLPASFVSADQVKAAQAAGGDFGAAFESNLNYATIDLFNRHTIVQHTMDQLVDVSDQFMFAPQTEFADDDSVQSMYVSSTVAATNAALPLESTRDTQSYEFKVDWRTQSFIVREVLVRKKSFQEVWSEIGGAWSTALLLISLFFASHSVQQGSVLKSVHTFHFSSPAKQQEQLQQMHGTVVYGSGADERNEGNDGAV